MCRVTYPWLPAQVCLRGGDIGLSLPGVIFGGWKNCSTNSSKKKEKGRQQESRNNRAKRALRGRGETVSPKSLSAVVPWIVEFDFVISLTRSAKSWVRWGEERKGVRRGSVRGEKTVRKRGERGCRRLLLRYGF
jgi:hypothetical protein